MSIDDDADEAKNTLEDEILPLDLSSRRDSKLRMTAKVSSVDSSCKRLHKTSIGVEMPATAIASTMNATKKLPSGENQHGGGISGRPYLHREVKSAFCQGDHLL